MEKHRKVAFISGSGSKLGSAIASHMLDLGFDLLLHYYTSGNFANEIKQKALHLGKKAILIQGDFSNTDLIDDFLTKLAESVEQEFGGIDVVINSASIMKPSRMDSISPACFQELLCVNAIAPIMIINKVASFARNDVSCINLTDVGADLLWKNFAGYSLSKKILADSVRYQTAQFAPKVRVNNLALGIFSQSDWMTNELMAQLVAKIPAGRIGRVEEILSAIDLLINNQYIIGQTIVVDGGRTVKGLGE